MRLLLDTSVLIDVLRSRRERREWLGRLVRAGYSLETCAINIAEIYSGIRPGEESRTDALLSGLRRHDISVHAAEQAGAFKNLWARKGRTIGLDDMIVASVAIEQDCILVTDNQKDFPMPEIRLFEMPK